jgi:hypothetical protein
MSMPRVLAAAAAERPLVTAAEIRRFDKAVTVRDRQAFIDELDRLVREKIAAAGRIAVNDEPLDAALLHKASALRAVARWEPSESDIQQGRAALLREFSQAHNLPLTEFARLAHKSRQQIYKDIAARRLLALDVGRRGQRLPDWQLDPAGLELTRTVLAGVRDVDAWTLYHALLAPMDAFDGRAAVAAVRRGNVEAVARAVLAGLGLQLAEPAGEAG